MWEHVATRQRHMTSPTTRHLAPIALIVTSALMVLALSHHPTARGGDFAAVVADMGRQATLDRVVHGALIAMITITLFVYVELSVKLGLHRAIVRNALIAYFIGACALMGAGLIDGFVMSWLAERYAAGPPVDIEMFRHMARLAEWGGVQSLSSFGLIGLSVGVALWSFAFIFYGRAQRILAGVGLTLSVLPAIALLTGLLTLQLHGMMLALLCQVTWNVTIGVAWMRGAFDDPITVSS
jgi:hypothetical protein